MGEMRRISAEVDAEMSATIAQAIESGAYSAEAEIVRAALEMWRRDGERRTQVERLGAMIDDAERRGGASPATDQFYERVKRRGRELLRSERR